MRIIGDRQRRSRGGTSYASALTTLGLFGLLAGLVAVAVWTARGAAQRATCTAQMRQLAHALIIYRNENGGYPPAHHEAWDRGHKHVERVSWETTLAAYVGGRELFACPSDSAAAAARQEAGKQASPGCSHSYDYVCVTEPAAEKTGASRLAPAADSSGYDRKEAARIGALLVCRHHESGEPGRPLQVLVAYDDGSVKWQPLAQLATGLRQPRRASPPVRVTR